MLVGAGVDHPGVCAFFHLGQAAAFVIIGIVAALFIDGQITVKQHHLAGGPKRGLAVCALQIDGGALNARGFHLRGDHPLPDQLIEPAQITLQPQRAGIAGQGGGADRLVGLLGVLSLSLVDARRIRDIGAAIEAADHLAGLVQGLGRRLNPVGPHIGDQADGLAADINALIELLRRLHCALRREAQLA